ncbi:MAG: isochorismatase family protein [Deltaproteobacteria bacterium]|nr:isochorismatase family protein [Deltaproteobacteria bacterium]
MPHRLLRPDESLLAVIDVQESHFPQVFDRAGVLDRICRTVEMAHLLHVPMLLTEHYPKGFGPTLPVLRQLLNGVEAFPKRAFGCFGCPDFERAVRGAARSHLVLVGTETPICILQTALGALERGLQPVVVADCVSARRTLDHDIALRRLERVGTILVTWEMLAYEWMRTAEHSQFREVLELVKRPEAR